MDRNVWTPNPLKPLTSWMAVISFGSIGRVVGRSLGRDGREELVQLADAAPDLAVMRPSLEAEDDDDGRDPERQPAAEGELSPGM